MEMKEENRMVEMGLFCCISWGAMNITWAVRLPLYWHTKLELRWPYRAGVFSTIRDLVSASITFLRAT
jgi:hypothetical protein